MSAEDEVEAGLLRAICDAPHLDAPRLIYADWLIERGDPRGELIVAQCGRAPGWEARCDALLGAHGPAWTAHVRAVPGTTYRFERGFISQVGFDSLERFLDHRAEIVRWMPPPRLQILGVNAGAIVVAPGRGFAAYSSTEIFGHGAHGEDLHQVYDLATGGLLAEHTHAWPRPAARSVRMWFAAGLRIFVIEYADERDPTDLRF